MRKGARRFLLSSSNWNNSVKAGVTYLNSHNVTSNANRNIGGHLELRLVLSYCPEQHFNLHPRKRVEHTAYQVRGLVSKEKTLLSDRAV